MGEGYRVAVLEERLRHDRFGRQRETKGERPSATFVAAMSVARTSVADS